MNSKFSIINIYLLITIIVYPVDAHAYINPSVFSLIGILLAGVVTVIGFYFYKIIDLFGSLILKVKNFFKK
tara:strand:+ start:2379 stop:2591 length:213 start_codon:yes stop_codon:yes gene_type:complete